MVKKAPENLTKEEMDSLMVIASANEFYNLIFNVAKKTGRRLGELYGVEEKKVINEINTGEVDSKKNPILKKVYKATGIYNYGVKWKDIIFPNRESEDQSGIMKIWVLKRRNYIQDESILSSELVSLLKKYYNKKKPQLDDYVFRDKSYRQIQSTVTQYAKKAGIKKKVMFHSFRHYFITHFLKQGWSHDKITKLTGHKSVASISAYDHVVAKDIKEDTLADMKGI